MNRECDSEDERVLRDAIMRYFPEANGPTIAMRTCLFTNTPDGHFVLDRHPDFHRFPSLRDFLDTVSSLLG